MREIEALMKSVATVVKDHVSKAFGALQKQLDEFKEALSKIPSLEEIAKEAAALIPTPLNGKDADPELTQKLVDEAVAKLPPVEPGKSVSVDELRPVLDELVVTRVKEIPPPEKGEPGKDADPELIQKMVDEAVAKLPPAEPGKSVSVDELRPVLDELVVTRVKEIPPPEKGEPGKDADPELIQKMVDEAVAKLPPAEPGKSVSVDELRPVLDELVVTRVKEIPPPEKGDRGEDGESVPLEDVRRMVDEAVAAALANLPAAKNGEPGRDAVDIEILPAINPEKSYPRGTYASHAGGLWRSYQATEGMKGWDCIIDGVASIEFAQVDERNFKLSVEKSSGKKFDESVYFPVVIYRGIFKAGQKYSPGDSVTWGGAQWHCDTETTDKPGEPGSKGWILSVKRGKDGKDGANGRDLVKGVKLDDAR